LEIWSALVALLNEIVQEMFQTEGGSLLLKWVCTWT
jgi:hypothetical protein